jgi:hypothetical protein
MGDLEEKRKAIASKESNRPKSAVPTADVKKNNLKIVVPPPRKIVSAQARKKTEDARRIEFENKILQSKITSLGGSSRPGTAYGAATSREEQSNHKVSTSKTTTAEESEETKLYNKLLQKLNSLKREVCASEEENKSLKAKLSNYDTQIKKFQQQIERLKTMNEVSGNPVLPTTTKSASKFNQSKSTDDEKSAKMTESIERSFTADEDAAVAPAKDDIAQHDAEYVHLKEEYDFLQNLRRSLLERIERSQLQCNNINHQQDEIQHQYDILQQRLISIQYGSASSAIIAPSKSLIAESKDEGKGVGKESMSKEVAALQDDNVLFNRFLSLENEFAELKETIDENPASMVYESNRMEYERLRHLLREKREILHNEITILKKKGNDWFQSTNSTESINSEIVGRRQMLSFLKSVELKLEAESKLKDTKRQILATEKELGRLVIKQKERELQRATASSS